MPWRRSCGSFSASSRGLAVAAAASAACAACAACYRGRKSASRQAESRPPRISISSAGSSGSSAGSSVVSVQSVQSDAEVEVLQACDSEGDCFKPRLLTNSPDRASSIRFSTRGISVHVQGIEHNTTKMHSHLQSRGKASGRQFADGCKGSERG